MEGAKDFADAILEAVLTLSCVTRESDLQQFG